MRWVAFWYVLGLLSLVVMGISCNECFSCENCTANNCAWITTAFCEQKCVEKGSKSDIVRGEETTETESCPVHNQCTVTSFDEIDGSFENGNRWSCLSGTSEKGTAAPAIVSIDDIKDVLPLHGEHLAYFGGYGSYGVYLYQEIHQNVYVPEETTHLSFYVSSGTGSVLVVYVDDNIVTYIDDERTSSLSDSKYKNVDVNIKKYANNRHNIRFLMYQYPQGGSHFEVDLIRLIRDDGLGDKDWTPGNWSHGEQCSIGCNDPDDNACDPLCSNVMCGFDNGQCEEKKYLIMQPDESKKACYSLQSPRKVVTTAVCPNYDDETCCIFAEELEFVKKQQRTVATQCGGIDKECQSALNRIFCAACSPRSADFYHGAKLSICPDFADEVFDACANSPFLNAQGICENAGMIYKNTASFIEQFGDISSDACFDGMDTEPEDYLWKMIAVGASGVVFIVIIILAIVIPCCIHKKNKKKQQNNGGGITISMASLDGNNMTLVPLDIVEDPDKAGVIYIEDDTPQQANEPVAATDEVAVSQQQQEQPEQTQQQQQMTPEQQMMMPSQMMMTPEQQQMYLQQQQMMMLMMSNSMMQMQMQMPQNDQQMGGQNQQM